MHINIVAFVSDEQKVGTPFEGRWVSDVSPEELEKVYQDFEPDVKHLLKVDIWSCCLRCLRLMSIFSQCTEKLSRWALHVVNELPLFTCDRVALIGDAVRVYLLARII
jgi:salicylate hydroxylase